MTQKKITDLPVVTTATDDGLILYHDIRRTIGDRSTAINFADLASAIADRNFDRGTLAARPAAASGNAGYLYLAIDDNGGTLYRSTGSAWEQCAPGVSQAGGGGGGSGEINTASNVGTAGVGVFKQKTGVNLEFRNINAASGNKITVTSDTANNEIDLDVNEANLAVTSNLASHTGNTNNPHNTTAAQVGAATTSHAATHLVGGSDAIAWGTIHGYGTLSSRPAAASSNAGYLYLVTDENSGTLYRSTGSAWVQCAPGVSQAGGGGAGETNTASNVGTAGVGVFKQKTGVNLEFRNINAASSNKITVTNDTANNEIDLDINEPNLAVTSNLSSHTSSTSNPHAVTHTQVGSSTAQWNADKLQGVSVSSTAPTIDGQGLIYDSANSQWKPGTASAVTTHASSHLAGASDALAWTTIHGSGLLSARPAAGSTNSGYLYLATDENGGTTYRSNGSSWVQCAPGVSQAGSGGSSGGSINTLAVMLFG